MRLVIDKNIMFVTVYTCTYIHYNPYICLEEITKLNTIYEGCMINSWTLLIVKAIDNKHV